MIPRRNKFNARKVEVDGITFASAKEARRYGELQIMQVSGRIHSLELQPRFELEVAGRPVLIRSKGYPNGRRASYRADFRYFEHGRGVVVEDVKSIATATEADRLRRAVVEAIYGIRIQEV